MKVKKAILIILSVMLVILELLPCAAALNIANAPEAGGAAYTGTYSYFSPPPFGHANFFPLMIALLSCVLLCLVLVYAFKYKALGAVKVISLMIAIEAVSPIALGMQNFTAVGAAIAVVAFAEAVWSFAIGQTAK